ncbi:uncharacterized protein [Lolium perenne]|uniref:uncharacterized protein n=1 Tax=Lolium perenne TaxID=4522 RepID=UPI0021F67477|nr:uncharacterized protein LOC127326715 [Lolium perenne]
MAQIKTQFTGKHSYEPDTCDALLRRFQQMSYNGVAISWRHYLETDFAMRALAGEDYLSSRSIQNQWIGKQIMYDVSKCMLIITMAMVDNKWVSFAWDLKRRQLTIHDASNKLDKWESHKIVATILNSALRKCIAAYFDGWNVDLGRWATVYTSASSRGDDKENSCRDFATDALYFCQTFDGVKQGGRLTSPKDDFPTQADLLFDVLHLKNNTGTLPPQFVQDLDE